MVQKLFGSDKGPSLLPETLLTDLVRRKPILLCLDYDGTISEIADEPELARPVRGAVEALRTIAAHRERVAPAIISGRTLEDLQSRVALPPAVTLAGVHGLQMLDATGKIEVTGGIRECREDLNTVRLWLSATCRRTRALLLKTKVSHSLCTIAWQPVQLPTMCAIPSNNSLEIEPPRCGPGMAKWCWRHSLKSPPRQARCAR